MSGGGGFVGFGVLDFFGGEGFVNGLFPEEGPVVLSF